MERKDLLTITFTWYEEKQWNLFRRMSWPICDRFAIDLGHFSIIIEMWFIRLLIGKVWRKKNNV